MFHKIIEEQMEALQGYVNSSVKTADEEAEIDEGGEDLEDEKIADAIDTEDLGAKADYAYANEVNK